MQNGMQKKGTANVGSTQRCAKKFVTICHNVTIEIGKQGFHLPESLIYNSFKHKQKLNLFPCTFCLSSKHSKTNCPLRLCEVCQYQHNKSNYCFLPTTTSTHVYKPSFKHTNWRR